MTVSDVIIIDVLGRNYDNHSIVNLENSTYVEDTTVPTIEYLAIPCSTVNVSAPGAPQAPISCPTIKYSGDTVTLKATPADGIGPYYVEFRKNGVLINPSRLGGTNPGTSQIYNAPENAQITRVYTLDDLDISSASGGTIDFSVYISDSCPTGPMTCTSTCTIAIGCIAPICNFTVT